MNYLRHNNGIKSFGENLKKIRKSKKISQEQLANNCNVEISQISRIERGVTNTSISMVYILAEALEIHTKDFFED